MIRRRSENAPLASTFVGVIEPHGGDSQLAAIQRLPLQNGGDRELPETHVALEITLATGPRDLFLAADFEDLLERKPAELDQSLMVQPQWNVRTDAQACWVRCDGDGTQRSIALWQGQKLTIGNVTVELRAPADFIQLTLAHGQAMVVAGDAGQLPEARNPPR